MKKYLTDYRNYIKHCLEKDNADWKKLLEMHKDKISFFQHERIVHLLVTILFALMTLMTVIAFVITRIIGFAPLILCFLVLMVPYIKHYYFLENQTQELYKDYDKILSKLEGKSDNEL